jgi:hypothetical protein
MRTPIAGCRYRETAPAAAGRPDRTPTAIPAPARPLGRTHLTRDERQAAQAERRSLCGPSEAPESDEPETEEQPEAPATGEETTTTSTPETTTTSTVTDETTTSTTVG